MAHPYPNKKLPFSEERLRAVLQDYPTPFHIYDERSIRENMRRFYQAFSWVKGFKNYFAVKATPNPHLMEILKSEQSGADCSSLAELLLAESIGLGGEEIMFTSNNTPIEEYQKAMQLGAIINIDDISHIEYIASQTQFPKLICFRYNPGPARSGNVIIGDPKEAKYGLTREQLFEAYKEAKKNGAQRFALHTMVVSNELKEAGFLQTAHMLFELVVEIKNQLGIRIEMVNLGGGIGIPYRPEEEPLDYFRISQGIKKEYESLISANGLDPLKIVMENGRMVTGPYGFLITRAIHYKNIYKNYIGVDASMADLMRPGMYEAYHHISVLGKEEEPHVQTYDVVGSLCENNDKFAVDRLLPKIDTDDVLVIHDAGAHGHSMGFNYNGKLKSAELLLKSDGQVQQIRRPETLKDYFATLSYPGLTSLLTK